MKKVLLLTLLASVLINTSINAQAFDKSTKLMTLSIGLGDMIHFPVGSSNPYSGFSGIDGINVNRTIPTGQLTFQAEFAVHKYVGVGFAVGIGGRAEQTASFSGLNNFSLGYSKEVNIPIAVLANFHFFQLIADKKGMELGNKLDVYAGLTLGSGVAIHPYSDNEGGLFNDALFYFGPHGGVNYYFTPKIAVHGEVGWGVTVIQAGITFKL